jgi:hypothetical protein
MSHILKNQEGDVTRKKQQRVEDPQATAALDALVAHGKTLTRWRRSSGA